MAAMPPADLPSPFGPYRIERLLGAGGMGSVYLATDTRLDRPVALKVPHFTSADGPDALDRFEREAKAAAALDHPNLCTVFDAGQIDGRPYLTMAFIEAGGAAKPRPGRDHGGRRNGGRHYGRPVGCRGVLISAGDRAADGRDGKGQSLAPGGRRNQPATRADAGARGRPDARRRAARGGPTAAGGARHPARRPVDARRHQGELQGAGGLRRGVRGTIVGL
jgi:hypothetical protein